MGQESDQQRLYRDLAWLWPVISPREDYVKESEQFAAVIKRFAQRDVRTLLHLGCGGGHNDFTFKQYFRVTGIDVSEAMLEHARALNPEAAYHVGDLRGVRLGQTFDAVAALDSMDYMLTEDDLRAAFATAFVHLKPGGVFLTYAEATKERFQQNKTSGENHSRDGVDVTFVEHWHDPDPADTTWQYSFVYFIHRGHELTIETDRHLCGVLPLKTWVRLLLETGFDVKQLEYTEEETGPIPLFAAVKPVP